MNKTVSTLLATALLITTLAGCATTAIMGSGFEKVANDTYTLKVATGGDFVNQAIAAEEAAKSRFTDEARQFLTKNPQYASYKVTNTERSVFPVSFYKYTVEFK